MKLLLAWSSGKDAAYALAALRAKGDEVVALLTTLTEDFGRVSMHGVREAVLDAQAAAVGLPLVKVMIPYPCPNEVYEARMKAALEAARAARPVDGVAFGDLFLADVRAYREARLAPTGLAAVFPLWGRPTRALAEEMIDAGVEAYVAVLDPRRVPRAEAGARFDRALLDRLPAGVDPCAENGEFHTVAAYAPGFARRLDLRLGETVERDGFVFRDAACA